MIYTKSSFYYGHSVDQSNNTIVFNEGSGDITAEMNFGKYSLTDFATEAARAMNAVSTNSYIVAVNRTTRIITLSGTSNFSFTPATATYSAYPLLGFTTDRSGANSYIGDVASGSEYLPQFMLQGYADFSRNKEYLQGTVRESASGIPEVVSFGLVRFMECEITFINDFERLEGAPIDENTTGVEDAQDFMDYLVSKGSLEFIPDRESPSVYYKVFLESTSVSKNGIGYKLHEMTNRGLNDFYSTKKLRFRELD